MDYQLLLVVESFIAFVANEAYFFVMDIFDVMLKPQHIFTTNIAAFPGKRVSIYTIKIELTVVTHFSCLDLSLLGVFCFNLKSS